MTTTQLRRRPRRANLTPHLFLLPFAALFLAFFIVPVAYAAYQSLFGLRRSGLGLGAPTLAFLGLGNYAEVLRDPAFWDGVKRVLLYGAVQVPVMLGLALLLALLLDEVSARLRNFYRAAFFAPYAVPGVVAALLWGFLYNPEVSPIIKAWGALGPPPDLLGPGLVLWAIANVATWQWTGYNMLIIYAGLQAIPPSLYEAARIDGCSRLGIARFIKVPLVAPTLVLTTVFSIIGTLQLFNEPVVLRQLSTGVNSSYTPNLYAYNLAFGNNNYNYAAAVAVVLAVVTFVFSFGFLRLTQRHSGV